MKLSNSERSTFNAPVHFKTLLKVFKGMHVPISEPLDRLSSVLPISEPLDRLSSVLPLHQVRSLLLLLGVRSTRPLQHPRWTLWSSVGRQRLHTVSAGLLHLVATLLLAPGRTVHIVGGCALQSGPLLPRDILGMAPIYTSCTCVHSVYYVRSRKWSF